MPVKNCKETTKGSALIYILIAVALLAALTVSLMEPSSQQTQSQTSTSLVTDLSGQISFVSSAISECIITYPNQDSELTTTEQKNAPYPINPQDPYFDTQTADPLSDPDDSAKYIRCPGNPGGTGATNQNHARIFGGSSGKFMPAKPSLFDDWTYYNGADGIFLMISTTKTDPFISSSLAKLDEKYSECESEVIDRRGLGSINLTTDTTPGDGGVRTCAANAICFRYWIILKSTALHQDASCP
jgi:type II secretory pathway pseudopilin PulG